jgi:hypothetical protein
MTKQTLDDILDERAREDAKWGGKTHDDKHVSSDWLGYLRHQLDLVKVGSGKK